jgi:hypothetical protein
MSRRSQWVDATLARSLLAGVSRALKSFESVDSSRTLPWLVLITAGLGEALSDQLIRWCCIEEFGRGDWLFHLVVGR